MRLYADVSEGYVYVVSAMATTGQRARMEMQVAETLQLARSGVPPAAGAGLRSGAAGTDAGAAAGHPA